MAARRSRQPNFNKLKSADTTKDYMKQKYKVGNPKKAPGTMPKSTKAILKNMARPLSHESVVVFRTKNPKITDPSMGVRQYTRKGGLLKKPPPPAGYGKKPPKPPANRMTRRGKINKEIFDAMNPDGPTNPTRRGTRLANKALRTPTERALARATARATAGVAIGGALLAYDAYKALDAYSKTSGPEKQMAKYKSKGGFSHMTSNPNKRGKQGLDY